MARVPVNGAALTYNADGDVILVAGATVTVYDAATGLVQQDIYTASTGGTGLDNVSTDAFGRYTFFIDSGLYLITIFKSGLINSQRSVIVPGEQAASSLTFVDTTTTQSISGNKTFTNAATTTIHNLVVPATLTVSGTTALQGSVTISGNLTATGNITMRAPETLIIEDNIIQLNSNLTGADPADTVGGGWELNRGSSNKIQVLWDEPNTRFVFRDGVSFTPQPIVAGLGTFDGLHLTDENPLRFYEDTGSGTNYVSFKAPATLAANNSYVLPSAYPEVDGRVLSSTTAGVLSWVVAADSSGTPGGTNGQVQFNDADDFGGDAGLVYDKTTDTLTIAGPIVSTQATGTAPFTVASTTKVTNLNVDALDGADWTAPPTIGSTTPGAGYFTAVRLYESGGSPNYIGLTPPTLAADNPYTLPDAYPGSDGYILSCTTAGVMSWLDATGVVAGAAGSDTQVQFNDGGSALGGDPGLVYNKTTNVLTISDALAVGTNPSTTGAVRLANNVVIKARNAGNSADRSIATINGSDRVILGDSSLAMELDGTFIGLAGLTSSFPALKRSGAEILVRLADDSAYATIDALSLEVGGTSVIDSSRNGAFTSVASGTTPATAGSIRIPNNSGLQARNAANSSNKVAVILNGSDQMVFGDSTVATEIDGTVVGIAGLTSSFPALKRSTTELQFRLADDSAYATIDPLSLKIGGTTAIDSSRNASFATSVSVGTNPSSTGTVRLAHGGTVYGRNSANNADRVVADWGGITDELRLGSSSAPTRVRSSLAAPGTLADGDWWVEVVGTTPTRVAAIKVRDGGATYTIASIQF